jgi:hypothetical protein
VIYTDWFAPEKRPSRLGLYLIRYAMHKGPVILALWDGKAWHDAQCACGMKRSIYTRVGGGLWPNADVYHWRGLTEWAHAALCAAAAPNALEAPHG